MAIFTKDGKMYVVDGPNPLVIKQASWERSKLVFHNFEWDEITQGEATGLRMADPPSPSRPNKEEDKSAVEFGSEADEPPDQTKRPETAERERGEEAPAPREFDLPYIKYKVLCHCLPAKIEQRGDSFYGESWGRVKYGSKFVFPCVVTSANDLTLEFWTSDPKEQISDKSIVYPFSYEVHNQATGHHDRVPYDDYRWWRISHRESKEGGWLFRANPSDFQPDFSD